MIRKAMPLTILILLSLRGRKAVAISIIVLILIRDCRVAPIASRLLAMTTQKNYLKNGLALISVAMVESGPWPGWTIVSGGKVSSLVLIPLISES